MKDFLSKKHFNVYLNKHRKSYLYLINFITFSIIIETLMGKLKAGNFNSVDLFLSLVIIPCVIFQILEIYRDFFNNYSKEKRTALYGKLLKNYFLILPFAIIFLSKYWK